MIEKVVHTTVILKGLAVLVLVPAAYLMVRRKEKQPPGPSEDLTDLSSLGEGEVIGSEEDLHRAEREVAKSSEERRAELGLEYLLVRRYSTLDGIRDTHITALLLALERKGLRSRVILESFLSPRAGKAKQFSGFYDLHLHSEDIEKMEPDELGRLLRQPLLVAR